MFDGPNILPDFIDLFSQDILLSEGLRGILDFFGFLGGHGGGMVNIPAHRSQRDSIKSCNNISFEGFFG